jgi:hypothetical protein
MIVRRIFADSFKRSIRENMRDLRELSGVCSFRGAAADQWSRPPAVLMRDADSPALFPCGGSGQCLVSGEQPDEAKPFSFTNCSAISRTERSGWLATVVAFALLVVLLVLEYQFFAS